MTVQYALLGICDIFVSESFPAGKLSPASAGSGEEFMGAMTIIT
jgi:hypothetical protein